MVDQRERGREHRGQHPQRGDQPPPAQDDPTSSARQPESEEGVGNADRPRTASASGARRQQAAADAGGTRPRDSFRPILSEQFLRRGGVLSLRPKVRPNVALVLVGANGTPKLFDPEKRPTVGELFWGGSGTLYEVDLGLHTTEIELDLPSHGDTLAFHAVVSIQWRVSDPIRIVQDAVRDVRETLTAPLRQRLGEVTRNYHARAVANAEKKAAKALRKHDVGPTYGLETAVFLHLTMHEMAASQLTSLDDVDHKIALEHKTQRLRALEERNKQDILAETVGRYRQLISAGDFDRFALQLAQNPQEAGAVVEALQSEKERNRRNATEFVTQLLDSKLIERWEIADEAREALDVLRSSMRGLLPTPSIPAVPAGGPDTVVSAEVVDETPAGDATDPSSGPGPFGS